MELERLFGLPAHPLVVHGAVVLLPLAALGLVIVALVPRSRRHYAPLVFAVAVAATIAVGLAQGSGEALEESVQETELVEEHAEMGESVLPWAIGLTIVSAAVVLAEPLSRRSGKSAPKVANVALAVLAVIPAVGATWTVVDVGHSGAKAAWDDVQPGAGEGDEGDDDGD